MSLSFPPQSTFPMTILDSSNGCDKYLPSTVLILNVPYLEGEDLPTLLMQLAQVVGVKVDPHEDINRICRMGYEMDTYSSIAVQFRNVFTCQSLNKNMCNMNSQTVHEMRSRMGLPGLQNITMKKYLGKRSAKVYRKACELYDQGEFTCVYDFNCQIYAVKYIEGRRCTIWLKSTAVLQMAKMAKDMADVRVIPEEKTPERDTHKTAVILGIPYVQAEDVRQIAKAIVRGLKIKDESCSSTLDGEAAILNVCRTNIDHRRPRIEVVFGGIDQKLEFVNRYQRFLRQIGQFFFNYSRVVINVKQFQEFADMEKIAHKMKVEHLIEDVFYVDNEGVYIQKGPLEKPLLITDKLGVNRLKMSIVNDNSKEIVKQAGFFCDEKFISEVWCDKKYIYLTVKPDTDPVILHCSMKEWNAMKTKLIESGEHIQLDELPDDIIVRAIFRQEDANVSDNRDETTVTSQHHQNQVARIDQPNEICSVPNLYPPMAVLYPNYSFLDTGYVPQQFNPNYSFLDTGCVPQQFNYPVSYIPIGPPGIVTHFFQAPVLVEAYGGCVYNNNNIVYNVDHDPNLRARFVPLAIEDCDRDETASEDQSLIYANDERANCV